MKKGKLKFSNEELREAKKLSKKINPSLDKLEDLYDDYKDMIKYLLPLFIFLTKFVLGLIVISYFIINVWTIEIAIVPISMLFLILLVYIPAIIILIISFLIFNLLILIIKLKVKNIKDVYNLHHKNYIEDNYFLNGLQYNSRNNILYNDKDITKKLKQCENIYEQIAFIKRFSQREETHIRKNNKKTF